METGFDLWFRNCFLYVKELVEENESSVVLDLGYVMKRKIDPGKWMDLNFGVQTPWRMMLIGDEEQGAKYYEAGDAREKAHWPVWSAENNPETLVDLIRLKRPERVVITKLPNAHLHTGKQYLMNLSELQESFPETRLHLHGLWGITALFGYNFLAGDVNPRDHAANKKVYLPDGRVVHTDDYKEEKHAHAMATVGMTIADLDVPRNRCMFSIRSIRMASKGFYKYAKPIATKQKDFIDLDIDTSDKHFRTVVNNRKFLRNKLPVVGGDKFHCDTCSLAMDCKIYRKGSVCELPGSEGTELARFFSTRNSDTILDGLGKIMKLQAERIETDIAVEMVTGEKNNEINKDLRGLFDQGTKLAKLIDPSLRGTNQTNVQVNVGAPVGASQSPKQMITSAIRELEMQGIPRENITPAMIQGLFEGMIDPDNQRRAIEGTVVRDDDF